MQKTIYLCDGCSKEIGAKAHISLMLESSGASGIALPPKGSGSWSLSTQYKRFIHFCNGKCIGAYFDARIKEATKK